MLASHLSTRTPASLTTTQLWSYAHTLCAHPPGPVELVGYPQYCIKEQSLPCSQSGDHNQSTGVVQLPSARSWWLYVSPSVIDMQPPIPLRRRWPTSPPTATTSHMRAGEEEEQGCVLTTPEGAAARHMSTCVRGWWDMSTSAYEVLDCIQYMFIYICTDMLYIYTYKCNLIRINSVPEITLMRATYGAHSNILRRCWMQLWMVHVMCVRTHRMYVPSR